MQPPCRICHARTSRIRANPTPWVYLECGECGVFWVEPMPESTEGDLGEHYNEVYYQGDARPQEDRWQQLGDLVASKRLQRIERDLGARGAILDIGCGTGTLLAVAASRGWLAKGVEVSPSAAAAARQAHGLDVHTGTLESANVTTGSMSAVVASHVLEHVPAPVLFLQQVREVLQEDGILVLALPNSRGFVHRVANFVHRIRGRYGKDKFACSLFPPSHLYAFDPSSLVRALSAAGFVPISITITGKGDPETYPMPTWKGAGRFAFAQRVLERFGRAIGQGSLMEVHAIKASSHTS